MDLCREKHVKSNFCLTFDLFCFKFLFNHGSL